MISAAYAATRLLPGKDGKGSVAEFDYLNSETSDHVLFNRNFATKTDKMFIASPLQSLSKYMYSPTR